MTAVLYAFIFAVLTVEREFPMLHPIAFKIVSSDESRVMRVRMDAVDLNLIAKDVIPPAIIVVRKATVLDELTTGIVDGADIIAAAQGDWSNAILVVADVPKQELPEKQSDDNSGDVAFRKSLVGISGNLHSLASITIDLIRAAGIDGHLVEKTNGRWVNAPLNSFTLKVQPRKGNIQFTLYGNPHTYDSKGFLLKDQNSYSRGWINDEADANLFVSFAKIAHARRVK